MLTLGFETANFGASIALTHKGIVLGEKIFSQTHGHAGFLIPEMRNMIKEQAVSWQEIEVFVTTTGPGSFTGVRLALATARALKSASSVPVLGIPTPYWCLKSFLKKPGGDFQNYHHSSKKELPILVCLEARREDVYCQLFKLSGQPMKEPANVLPEKILRYTEGPCHIIGDGIARLNGLGRQEKESFILWESKRTAQDLCLLVEEIIQNGQEKNFPLTPLYLREPDTASPKNLY